MRTAEKETAKYCPGWLYGVTLDNEIILSYEDRVFVLNGVTKVEHYKYCYLFLIITTDKGMGVLSPMGWLIEPIYNNIICFDENSEGQSKEIERLREPKYFICDGTIIRIDLLKYKWKFTITDIKTTIEFVPEKI